MSNSTHTTLIVMNVKVHLEFAAGRLGLRRKI